MCLPSLNENEDKKDGSHEQQAIKVRNKGNDDDNESGLLQIDQLHHWFQKLKDQPHNSADTHGISFGVNQDCYERNLHESKQNRNVYMI